MTTLTKFCTLLTTYLPVPPVDMGEGIPLLLQMENLHIIDISNAAHPPRLANVVKERPLSMYRFISTK